MVSFMRLSFITQFKIEFLLKFTICRKVLGKMPDLIILNFIPEDNQKINNKNINPNKLITAKKSK